MRISVNGRDQDIAEGTTIQGLLGSLSIKPASVAVERNAKIVIRKEYERTALEPGDSVEIVTFVGGG